MPSRETFLKLAAEARAAAARHRSLADQLEEQADTLSILAEKAGDEGLSGTADMRSILGSNMEPQKAPASRAVAISYGRTRRNIPVKKALLEAGLTDGDVAELLDVGRSTVNAWCNGTRPIPRRHAETLNSKHRIPLRRWPKISE